MSDLPSDDDSREARVDEAIASYLEAVERGEAPDKKAYLARYPDLAGELSLFLSDRDKFQQAAGGLSPSPATIDRGPSIDSDPSSTVTFRPVVPQVRSNRYLLKHSHARGGMGEIWLAEDREIGRQVAFKMIRAGHEQQRERFFAEAQITGQLEHPSIVPVHDLGVDEAGKPFYVMKFVQGRTLQEVIADFHAAENRSDVPREVQQRRLLDVFVALCRTVAYAHSRGVIHRDLKPDNVMVGPYGETLVLDWGLAKVLNQGEAGGGAESAHVHLTYSGTSNETQVGSVIGALPYMAPEVADGKAAEADQRTDVYLLGGTLYEILTGAPPRRGSSRAEMLELARTVPVAPPRQARGSVPRPLDAICLKATARRPQDRYGTALELAEDVERYLAGEAVSAYREPWTGRAWRWAKRHRKLLTRSVAVLALSAAACVAVVLLLEANARRVKAEGIAREAKAREQATVEVREFRRLADEARFLAANTNPIAERVPYFDPRQGRLRAEEALGVAGKWGSKLELLVLEDERGPLGDDIYDLLLLLVQIRIDDLGSQAAGDKNAPEDLLRCLDQAAELREPTRSYHRLRAVCCRQAGETQEALTEGRLASDERTPLTVLDHFLAGEEARGMAARQTGAEEDLDEADRLKRTGPIRSLPLGQSVKTVDVFAVPDHKLLERATDEYRRALELDPKHYWSQLQLGRCYLSLGRTAEAAAALGTCVALRPDAKWGYSARGLALALSERFEEASLDLDRAIELDHDFRPVLLNRGFVHWRQERRPAALDDFAAALRPPAEKHLIEAAFYRGQLYLDQGNLAEALADFKRLSDERPGFHAVHMLSAQAHLAQGDLPAALDDLNRFLSQDSAFDPESGAACALRGHHLRRLAEKLPAAAVKSARKSARELALSQLEKAVASGVRTAALFQDLGAARMKLRQVEAAVEAYGRGLELAPDHVKLLFGRGFAFRELGNAQRAEADFVAALRVDPKYSEAHSLLGCVRARIVGQADGARREADLALLDGSGDYLVLHNVACIHAILSETNATDAVGYQDLALATLRREIELWRILGTPPSALDLIKADTDFGPALRARPEFQQLLADPAAPPPTRGD